MRLRYPRVWPSLTSLTVALTLHTAVVCSVLLFAKSREAADATFAEVPPIVPIVAAAIYGIHRVRAFHPALQPEYRHWLGTTPWSPAKELPLGPVHLSGADVTLLGAAVAAAWPYYGLSASLGIAKVFLGTYLTSLVFALFITGEYFAAYAVWAGLGGMIVLRSPDGPFFAAAGITYGIGLFGFLRSMERFPWGFTATTTKEVMTRPAFRGGAERLALGWPFSFLGPQDRYYGLGAVHGTLLAFLGGWTVLVVLSLFPVEGQNLLYVLALYSIVTGPLVRILLYRVGEFRSPISLAGRVCTGRWIIPGYDRVFVPSLVSAAVGFASLALCVRCEVPASVGAPVTVSLALLILFTTGPDRRTWLLSSPSRIAPLTNARSNQWA